MSKTGPARPVTPTRKQLSRAEREQQLNRYILIGTAVVIGIVILSIGFGIFDQAVLVPRRTVALVNGVEITIGDFQKAVRYQRYRTVLNYFQTAQTMQMFGSDQQSQSFFHNQLQQLAEQLDTSTTSLESMGREVINTLIDNELIRQEAQKRGITVEQAEVIKREQESFNYYPNGTPTPSATPSPFPTDVIPPTATSDPKRAATLTAAPTLTPTATFAPTATSTEGPSPTPLPSATPYTAEGFATVQAGSFGELQKQANLSQTDYQHFLEIELYRDKLTEALSAEIKTTEEQVHARHILIRTTGVTSDTSQEVEAKIRIDQIYAKLKAGGDWEAVAAEFSEDTSNAQQGGELGWFGHGEMVAEFDTAAFNTSVGTFSEPIQTSFGWHIIQVLAKEERPVSEQTLAQKRRAALDEWLQQQRDVTLADGKKSVEIVDGWQNFVPKTPGIPTPVR